MTSPTFGQIKAMVAAVLKKLPETEVVGIYSPTRWTGERQMRDGERSHAIYQCDSPLAMQVALREPVSAGTIKTLVTPLETKDLSQDILLRLAKLRLLPLDSWQNALGLFQATAVDPRLRQQTWIADLLVERLPLNGYPAARGGYLDADVVWPLLLQHTIGLADETPDLVSILKWSLDEAAVARFRVANSEFRDSAAEWLSEKAGKTAELILTMLARSERADAVPLGLVAGVVFHPHAAGKLDRAVGKLEGRFLGDSTPNSELMLRWSTAATEVVRALRHTELRSYRQVLERAEEILRDIQADQWAWLSNTLPTGFHQRLSRFGKRLLEVIERQPGGSLKSLQSARDEILAHDQASREQRCLDRVEMSVRLLRWLETADYTNPAASLAVAARDYWQTGSFVDWARLSLRVGDPVQDLSQVYAQLFARVTQIREQQSKRFAELLVDATAAGSPIEGVVPVEKILAQVVAPLAEVVPVLFVVIDGMSAAVCRELLADLTRHEWVALASEVNSAGGPGLATMPSVTEFSRTSLMCGTLRSGDAAIEKQGFSGHRELLEAYPNGSPPILFHKASLQEIEDSVLAADVRLEISNPRRRIVGVVVNAVDDHLLKGQQMDIRWSRDEIKVLPALFHEARQAGRIVVLTSDHGHMLDCQTELRTFADSGERWRKPIEPAGPGEFQIEGPRVVTPEHRLVAPWSEQIRYGAMKKNGYHGGLAPQEMVVPIVALSSGHTAPSGWRELPVESPAWWDEPLDIAIPTRPQPVAVKLKKIEPELPLFDREPLSERAIPAVVATTTGPADWIITLPQSPIFAEQKRYVGRGLPADEVLVQLLNALDRRGGKMTAAALARELHCPEVRLPGLLAKVRRLLNVDGYEVISWDPASETVELNRELLLKQFDLI